MAVHDGNETERRRFVAIQAGKAAVGAGLGLAFLGAAGRPDTIAAVAMAGLLAPALLALAGLCRVRLALLEQVGLIGFSILIGYLAVLTGGVGSPFTVWLALVPAEAALAARDGTATPRQAVTRAGLAAALVLLAVVSIQGLGLLPPSRLVFAGALPGWAINAASMLAALVQAVLIAAAAQDRQRAADAADLTHDIAQRRHHEDALIRARDMALEASKAKSRFLANMSHELRTPLNAIIGFSEMMSREMFGHLGPRYRDYAQTIHESGSHLLELINGVLDMSKIEAGKFELSAELFDLEDVAQSALRFVKIPAERARVALKLRIAPGARLIFADRRAVKQILVNLLSNGVKYTPPGGTVAVGAQAGGGAVILVVADTGTGISESDVARLGQPFEQVESAEVRAKEGTGLGLALVRSLAALHGGQAVITSALGEGTVVTVRLPHAEVDAQGERPATATVIPFRAA